MTVNISYNDVELRCVTIWCIWVFIWQIIFLWFDLLKYTYLKSEKMHLVTMTCVYTSDQCLCGSLPNYLHQLKKEQENSKKWHNNSDCLTFESVTHARIVKYDLAHCKLYCVTYNFTWNWIESIKSHSINTNFQLCLVPMFIYLITWCDDI
jgi:hypothetical protein